MLCNLSYAREQNALFMRIKINVIFDDFVPVFFHKRSIKGHKIDDEINDLVPFSSARCR